MSRKKANFAVRYLERDLDSEAEREFVVIRLNETVAFWLTDIGSEVQDSAVLPLDERFPIDMEVEVEYVFVGSIVRECISKCAVNVKLTVVRITVTNRNIAKLVPRGIPVEHRGRRLATIAECVG